MSASAVYYLFPRRLKNFFFISEQSPVFENMLLSSMKESNENVIELDSQDPTAVKLFLRLIYEGKADLPLFENFAIPVTCLAHQYQVNTIIDLCESFFIQNISPRDCFEIYRIAKLFELTDLIYTSFKYIQM